MLFEEIASRLVHTASRLVRGRIVNIMDTDGVIVASSDPARGGTVHEGARKVVRTGRPVAIEKDDVPHYPGAREGYNLPVFSEERLIAVVGIYGNPDEVRDSAYILEAYTEQFFRQNALNRQNRIFDGLRASYLRILLNLSEGNDDRLDELAGALDLRISFPVRMITISICGDLDSLRSQQMLNRAADEILFHKLALPEHDVWAMVDDRLLLLKSGTEEEAGRYLKRLFTCVEEALSGHAQLCAGRLCQTLTEARLSGDEALTLCGTKREGLLDILAPGCGFSYLMRRTAEKEQEFIRGIYMRISERLNEKDLEMMLATAAAYYDAGGSVKAASEALHIHKNTLQYRMRRLWETLSPLQTGAFEREYLLRLCILYHRQLRPQGL